MALLQRQRRMVPEADRRRIGISEPLTPVVAHGHPAGHVGSDLAVPVPDRVVDGLKGREAVPVPTSAASLSATSASVRTGERSPPVLEGSNKLCQGHRRSGGTKRMSCFV
jgi:hypothetical protein